MADKKRIIAATELLLILPAGIFLTAVVARHLEPLQYFAQKIVIWYAIRLWTMWVLLVSLPLVALFTGCIILLWNSNGATNPSRAAGQSFLVTRFIAAVTLVTAVILAIVILHMLAN